MRRDVMDAERWARIERLYHEALGRASEDRATLLGHACENDSALRHEVESLLAHDGDPSFLGAPAGAFDDGPAGNHGQRLGPYVK
jgi:hypothetical protein